MIIKTFTFPSFEEWYKTQKYYQRIGDYICAIDIYVYGNAKNKYTAILANSCAKNIHLDSIFYYEIACNTADHESLKKWYEKATTYINNTWKDFIFKTYFCKE